MFGPPILTRLLVYLPDDHAMLLGDIEQCTFSNGRYRQISGRFKPRAQIVVPKRSGSPPPTSRPVKQESPLVRNILVRMERAYSRRDGIAFTGAIRDINQKLLMLKEAANGNMLLTKLNSWAGMPFELVNQVYEETYQRSAGPQVKELTKPKSGKVTKSETYGELNIGYVSYCGCSFLLTLSQVHCGIVSASWTATRSKLPGPW
jgi:hypothetical protein